MRRPITQSLMVVACALSVTSCSSGGVFAQPEHQYSSNDPNRPPEPVPDLPEHDPAAVALELRTRMVAELNAILADTPQPVTDSGFRMLENDTGRIAEIGITFGKPTHTIGTTYARAFDKAAIAHGWTPAGDIGFTNLRKGPYFLRGGDGAYGVTYDMDTSPLTVDVDLGTPYEQPVPGLLIKQSPTPSTRPTTTKPESSG